MTEWQLSTGMKSPRIYSYFLCLRPVLVTEDNCLLVSCRVYSLMQNLLIEFTYLVIVAFLNSNQRCCLLYNTEL